MGHVTTASRKGCCPHSRNGCPLAMSSSNIKKKGGWGLPTEHWGVQGQETHQLDHTLTSPRVPIYKVTLAGPHLDLSQSPHLQSHSDAASKRAFDLLLLLTPV